MSFLYYFLPGLLAGLLVDLAVRRLAPPHTTFEAPAEERADEGAPAQATPLLVGEALGMGCIPTLKKLGHLEHAVRLVRSAGRKFLFDHHQVQEALYEGLGELLREEYHAALGETLEEMSGAS